MATRRILTYPHPILRKEADPWNFFAEEAQHERNTPLRLLYLESQANDLMETLEKVDRGAALAAPQIGLSLQLLCFNVAKADKDGVNMPLFAVNPHILEFSKETDSMTEGCLSFPNIYEPISRPLTVKVEWEDLFGERSEQSFSGFWARCWQHEIDHLQGKLFIDVMDRRAKYRTKAKMEKR